MFTIRGLIEDLLVQMKAGVLGDLVTTVAIVDGEKGAVLIVVE